MCIKFSVCIGLFFCYLCVWWGWGALVHMRKSEGIFIESVLCFHFYMGSGSLTRVVGLYPLSPFASSQCEFFSAIETSEVNLTDVMGTLHQTKF